MPDRIYEARFPTLDEYDEEMAEHGLDFEPSFIVQLRRALAVALVIDESMGAALRVAPHAQKRPNSEVEAIRPAMRIDWTGMVSINGSSPIQAIAEHKCPDQRHVIRYQCIVLVANSQRTYESSAQQRVLASVGTWRDNIMFVTTG